MLITCIGHSGFAVEVGGVTLIFDYYIDPAGVVDGILAQAQRLYVLVSHSHRDHLCMDIFGWRDRCPQVQYVLANECRRKLKRAIDLDAHRIAWLHHDEDWSDDRLAIHAYDSTDVGVGFLVDIDGRRIYHAGDYTCWHCGEEQDPQVVRKARGDFHAIVKRIVAHSPHIHLAMMPVVPNIGGDWAYGPRQLLRAVRVDTFIPMHMWGRDREATEWSLYRNPAHGPCVHLLPGQQLTL